MASPSSKTKNMKINVHPDRCDLGVSSPGPKKYGSCAIFGNSAIFLSRGPETGSLSGRWDLNGKIWSTVKSEVGGERRH